MKSPETVKNLCFFVLVKCALRRTKRAALPSFYRSPEWTNQASNPREGLFIFTSHNRGGADDECSVPCGFAKTQLDAAKSYTLDFNIALR